MPQSRLRKIVTRFLGLDPAMSMGQRGLELYGTLTASSALAGGSLMYYLGTLTEWAHVLGPLGLGLLSLGTAVVIVAIIAGVSWARSKIIANKTALLAIESGSANPLARAFDHQIIRLSDFFSPYYIPHDKKRFQSCIVLGPGVVFFNNVSINGGNMKKCQVVIVRSNQPLFGVTAFEAPVFVDCDFCEITFAMTKDTYFNLSNQEFKKFVPVINEKQITDLS